jgi:isoleucyl-tRNA synthetase
MEFFDTDVSKWYVRRSRARFYDVDAPHNRSAFATLHEVLVVTARLLAPFAPFVTDWVHRELTGVSVHLARYTRGDGGQPVAGGDPHHPPAPADPALELAMSAVRELVTQGHAARDEAGINVRQPLSRMVCVVPQGLGQAAEAMLPELLPLLAAELNVKSVEFASSADAIVTLEAKPNFRALGKRFGKSTPLAAQAVASLTSDAIRAFEQGAEVAISVEGASHLLSATT